MPFLPWMLMLLTLVTTSEELALVRHDPEGYSLCLWQQGWEEPRVIAKLPGECSRLAWSPDGSLLVASLDFSDDKGLWLFDRGSTKGRRLKTLPGIDSTDAVFSPDGYWIYYTTDSSEGGTIRRIRISDERDEAIMDVEAGDGTTGWVAWIVWALDKKSLYYMRDEGWGEWQLWNYDMDSGNQKPLWDESCGTPALSPDGKSMLMWTTGDDPSQISIMQFSLDAQTGELTLVGVFAGEAPWQSMPSFSSDSQLVAYVAGKGEETIEGDKPKTTPKSLKPSYEVNDIWVKSAGGGEPWRLPGSASLGRDCPVWKLRFE